MYVYPKLREANKRAKKYGATVYSSQKYPYKLMVIWDGKEIHFGHRDYDDYLIHQDKERRRLYRKRHKVSKSKNKKSFWARYILW